jgi:type IV pilus assembly protein PilV
MSDVVSRPFAKRRAAALLGPGGRAPQKGIALLEALVSILVFSFGVLGILGLAARAIQTSVSAEDRNRAAMLANEIASTMWLSGTVSLTTTQLSDYKTKVTDLTGYGLPNATLTVTPVTTSTNDLGTVNAADITITWKQTSSLSTDASSQLTTRVTLP